MGHCTSKTNSHNNHQQGTHQHGTGHHGLFHKNQGPTISLEAVAARSGNPNTTKARYHGQNERSISEDYEVLSKQVLGEGCNGKVVVAQEKESHRKFALKRFKKFTVDKATLRQVLTEVEIYLSIDHPNIARLHDVYETAEEISMLTELCEGGELYARLINKGSYSETEAKEAAAQMLRAIGYLHAHHVVHRDLKLENFLYDTPKDDAVLKLIDFGFANYWDPSTKMMATCGSIAYVSPDVLSRTGYTSKCDIWSLGVTVFMLLVGYPPFHGEESAIKADILAGSVDWNHPSRWKKVSPEARDFVSKLLTKDPDKRPDAQEALSHNWLKSENHHDLGHCFDKEVLESLATYLKSSRVRRAALQLLAQELQSKETDNLTRIFNELDTHNEGTVRLSDLKKAIRASSEDLSPQAPGTPAAQLRRANSADLAELFEVLDTNHDEQIYYSDFLAATMEHRSKLREESVRAAFHRLDHHNTGVITTQDFKEVLGDTFQGVNVEQIVSEADPEGEGVTFHTFRRMVSQEDALPSGTQERLSPSDLLASVP
mmetsp:Transcript_10730/g.24477  ORF Transcript_10730/g.24477 Transcript_10730/m.24477 type:complete len:544 (-) Transcript_10730:56-1687(-)